MPELPEVECLTRQVRDVLKGETFGSSNFLRSDLREPIPVKAWQRNLDHEKVIDVFRRSKYLLVKTGKGFGVIHLGMTGNLLLKDTDKPDVSHTHAIFEIQLGKISKFLHYVDPRRFGRISYISGNSYEEHPFFSDLGPEPLDAVNLADHFYKVSRGKKGPVKSFLMDPRVVVGVGNIYASESLFRAKIIPTRAAGMVTLAEFKVLAKAVKATLEKAIKAGGTTFRDYRAVDGQSGYFAVELKVYGRDGEPCSVCESPIKHMRQAGRSSFYCDECQV